mgnify:FL=1
MATLHYSLKKHKYPKKIVTVFCASCQEALLIKEYRTRRSKNFFCKPQCHTEYFRTKICDTKICSGCKEPLPLQDFANAKKNLSGKRAECKVCARKKRMDSYHADPETHKARHRIDNQKHKQKRAEYAQNYKIANKDRILTKKKLYNKKHRQRDNETRRERRARNPEMIRQRELAYRKAHPEIYRLAAARRRATLRGTPLNDLTRAQWEFLKKLYSYRCVYCGGKPQRLTKDHLTPLVYGGAHTMANIVPACGLCNSRKGKGNVPVPIQPALGLIL